MPALAAIIFFLGALLAGPNVYKTGDPFLKTPVYSPGSTVCLDESTASTGIAPFGNVPEKLEKIKRPVSPNDFHSPAGYTIPACQNKGQCGQPDDNNGYLLIATRVKVDPVAIRQSPSDIQMLKMKKEGISNDPAIAGKLNGRLFRTFCGDWCCDGTAATRCRLTGPDAPGPIPYQGTFHCDFLFYLEDKGEIGQDQLRPDGSLSEPNSKDANLPKNGSLFSIYFRQGAAIPEKIRCKPGSTPTPAAGLFKSNAFAQQPNTQSAIRWDDKEWLFKRDGSIKNKDVNPEWKRYSDASGNNVITNPLTNVNGDFEVFLNLAYPSSNEILYLVKKGEFDYAIEPLSRPTPTSPPAPTPPDNYMIEIRGVDFKEFHLQSVTSLQNKSLKLSTFKPPMAAGWIRNWLEESKPAIYLYPEKPTKINVKLNPKGYLTVSDPPYDPVSGWDITAYPDGTIREVRSQKSEVKSISYPYLYYEANLKDFYIDPSSGFIVSGKELVSFFREKLLVLGLNQKEAGDFIDYWMGRLQTNTPYYFIHFLTPEEIEDIEPLVLSVKPDSEIRIRAYFKPLNAPLPVLTQALPNPPARAGFTLVEWGGMLDH